MVTAVGGELWIDNNDLLQDLSPLKNIQSIGENSISGGSLYILNNEMLQSLSGLENIAPASIVDLNIYDNPSLSECAVNSICDYLLDPAGTIDINNNATGCNSQEEIELACLTSTEEITFTDGLTISPNPMGSGTWIEFTVAKKSMVTLKILSMSGQEVTTLVNEFREKGKQKFMFDGEEMKPGVYFCVLRVNDPTSRSFGTGHIIKLIKL